MTKKILSFLFLVLITPFIGVSQEVLSELTTNPIIHAHSQLGIPKAALGDTITLPFVDDFSELGIYPNPAYWMDDFAYVNAFYAVNPVSIGVATLDGLDSDGMPYEFVINQPHGLADQLTSKYFDLTGYSPGDSLYLSFFYQPQGYGNAPETEDSLVLQFAVPTDTTPTWKSVWKATGTSLSLDSSFTQVLIPVVDADYFTNAFQFRFINYATLSGNVDHWHLDYIRFEEDRNINDTLFTDVAMVYPLSSVLKRYQAMPWEHYKVNPEGAMGDSLYFFIYNYSGTTHNVTFRYLVTDENDEIIDSLSSQAGNVPPLIPCSNISFTTCGGAPFTNNFDSIFPTDYTGDVVEFLIEGSLKRINADIDHENDTVYYTQRFANYYAYDDGTAESAYGLNVAGASLAYRFVTPKSDTIRGVQIHFSPVLLDVSDRKFQLAVWAGDNTPIGDPIYVSDSLYSPQYLNYGPNGFWTYEFDSVFTVDGTFFVGWIQESNDLLNVGFDRNKSSNENMFFDLSGDQNWNQSNLKGSWMIRPLFGGELPNYNSVSENRPSSKNDFKVFPNPTSGLVNIMSQVNLQSSNYQLRVFDSVGKMVKQESFQPQLNLGDLPKGFYMLNIADLQGKGSYTYKIVLR